MPSLTLSLLIFFVAMVYASVGHGGASGYLAALSLLSAGIQTQTQMGTSALVLNLWVSGVAFLAFWRSGHFSPSLTWPFLASSIPAAMLGGALPISGRGYYHCLAGALCLAAFRLCLPLSALMPARAALAAASSTLMDAPRAYARGASIHRKMRSIFLETLIGPAKLRSNLAFQNRALSHSLPHLQTGIPGAISIETRPPLRLALIIGGGVGLVSGVVGVGGGIFLSPILLLCRWADAKTTAASSAAFIFLNSLSGLMGRFWAGRFDVGMLSSLIGVAVMGGFIGSRLGTDHLPNPWLCRILAVVLLIAAGKLLRFA